MIGPVSSAPFSSFSMQRHPQGERDAALPGSEKEQTDRNALKSEKAKKEAEEKRSNPRKLDEAEKQQVETLKQRDTEVRAHEQAHMAAAGSLAQGGPNYVYQTGPDGRQYAVGGNVKIDTSPGRTPEETIRKAQQIRAAALAPSDPSPQDLKVAAAAASMEAEAASKEAGNSEKEAHHERSSGEITSSRQLFAASPGRSDPSEADSDLRRPGPDALQIQAAQLYGNHRG